MASQKWDLLLCDGIVFRDIQDPSSAKARREIFVHDSPALGVTPTAAQCSLAVIGSLELIDKALPR